MPTKTYLVRSFTPKDEAEVYDILFNKFDADEPLMKYLLKNPLRTFTEDVDIKVQPRGVEVAKVDSNSLVAVERGKIMGIAINKVLEKDQKDVMYAGIENYRSKKVYNAIIKVDPLLHYIGSECKISTRFPGFGKGVLLDKLYVDPTHRGKGIAKALIEETRNVAKRNGCNYIKVIASSLYTALALERLGFEKIYSIDYKDYKVNGEVVFNIEPPHTSLAVYIQHVDDRG